MNDSNRRWFYAKDIKNLLGITPGRLFHWSRSWQLVQPAVRAEGRQGKDKWDFKGILYLTLIRELLRLGICLADIKAILSLSYSFQKKVPGSVFSTPYGVVDFFQEILNREEERYKEIDEGRAPFESVHYILARKVGPGFNMTHWYIWESRPGNPWDVEIFMSSIMVNLTALINIIEHRTKFSWLPFTKRFGMIGDDEKPNGGSDENRRG